MSADTENGNAPIRLEELDKHLTAEMIESFSNRDGYVQFADQLRMAFLPDTLIHDPEKDKPKNLRIWELVGMRYMKQHKFHEAITIFDALYEQILQGQNSTNTRGHKGAVLVYIHECCQALGLTVHSKRYLMLAFCEDAISYEGNIAPNISGVYPRLVGKNGLPDSEFRRYAKQFYALWNTNQTQCFYPEWMIQEVDQGWISEYPSHQELSLYRVNRMYVNQLMKGLGDKTGKNLERLAEYILSCMPGCRTSRRKITKSTDYDVICSIEGGDVDFRSELGRYFVCECKDWVNPADFSTIAKFCRVLDSIKARFGIIFSSKGISGANATEDAEREQLKVFQDRGMVIVVIDEKDLALIAGGINFINLLRSKYEKVRLDLARE